MRKNLVIMSMCILITLNSSVSWAQAFNNSSQDIFGRSSFDSPALANYRQELDRLQAEFDRVDHRVPLPDVAQLPTMAAKQLSAHAVVLDRPQLLVVVNRDPHIQELAIIAAFPEIDPSQWPIIGATHVSTGQSHRHGYFITPVGVFPHDGSILDYRAQGTYNENHIRGLGLKGMRVWDFGWQQAVKGWKKDKEIGQIRLEMHATDPANLETRLGRPASEACVRVPATLNKFMDLNGVLDADVESQSNDPRFAHLLAPNRTPSTLAGRYLVVVDTSFPQ